MNEWIESFFRETKAVTLADVQLRAKEPKPQATLGNQRRRFRARIVEIMARFCFVAVFLLLSTTRLIGNVTSWSTAMDRYEEAFDVGGIRPWRWRSLSIGRTVSSCSSSSSSSSSSTVRLEDVDCSLNDDGAFLRPNKKRKRWNQRTKNRWPPWPMTGCSHQDHYFHFLFKKNT